MLELVRPTIYTDGQFKDIDPERLLRQVESLTGQRTLGVSFDLDSTILAQNELEIPAESMEVIVGFGRFARLGVNSNAGGEARSDRVEAKTADMSEATNQEVVSVTSHELGGWRYRKPSRRPSDVLAHKMGLPSGSIIHIDDQLLKGGLGANRAGYQASILVDPCAPEDDPRGVRYVQRPIETGLIYLMGLSGGTPDYSEVLGSLNGADAPSRVTAEGYRNAKLLYGAAAIGAAMLGRAKVSFAEGRRPAGMAGLVAAAGLLEGAVKMRGHERRQKTYERLLEMSQAAADLSGDVSAKR